MQRIVISRPGGYDALRLVDEPDPVPSPGQYLVRVHAAGVNFADVVIREGYYAAARNRYPITPGFEFAGVIEKAGQNAGRFRAGQQVCGYTLFGGYASMQTVAEGQLFEVPAGWSLAEAAALPTAHLTAWYCLHVAGLAEGETVLVHSAAGGVGLALVQQAALRGCRVLAVVGHEGKVEVARRYGASHVLVRNRGLWRQVDQLAPQGLDVVLDANGVTTPKPAFRRLRKGGRLVVYGFADMLSRGRRPSLLRLAWRWLRLPTFSPFDMTARNLSLHGVNLAFLEERQDLAQQGMQTIMEWISQGKILPSPVTTLPVAEVAQAHRLLEGGLTTGKLVLTFPPPPNS